MLNDIEKADRLHESLMARGSAILLCQLWDNGLVGRNASEPDHHARYFHQQWKWRGGYYG